VVVMRVFLFIVLFAAVAFGLIALARTDSGQSPLPVLRLDTPRPYVPDSGLDAAEERALENLQEAERRLAEIRAEEQARIEQATLEASSIYMSQTRAVVDVTAAAEATDQQAAWIIDGRTATYNAGVSTETAEYQATKDVREEEDAAFLRREQQRLEERHDLTNRLLAVLPYAIYILAAAVGLAVAVLSIYKYAIMPWIIARDKLRGGGVILHTNQGQVMNMDRVPVGITTHNRAGVTAPPIATPEAQERTTARAQIGEMMNRGLPGQVAFEKPRKAPDLLASAAPPEAPALPAGPKIEIILAGQTPRELEARPEIMPVLDGEWRNA
jgi:hypothetical protein